MHHHASQICFFLVKLFGWKGEREKKHASSKVFCRYPSYGYCQEQNEMKMGTCISGKQNKKHEILGGIWITSEGLVCLEGWEGRRPWNIYFHLQQQQMFNNFYILIKTCKATNDIYENWEKWKQRQLDLWLWNWELSVGHRVAPNNAFQNTFCYPCCCCFYNFAVSC